MVQVAAMGGGRLPGHREIKAMITGFEGAPPMMMAQLFTDVGGFLSGPQVLAALGELLVAALTSLLLLIFPGVRT